MHKEAAPLFDSSFITHDPYTAQMKLASYYALERSKKTFQLQEFGTQSEDMALIYYRLEAEVETSIKKDIRDEDGHFIFERSDFEKNYVEGQKEAIVKRVEEPYKVITSHLLDEYIDNSHKELIFESCETQDLADAVIATGGIPESPQWP